IADDTGKFVAGSNAERSRYGGACFAGAAPSADCWRTFLTNLGRALWRRPLQPAEVDMLASQVPAGEVARAIQTMVLPPMTSPNAIFLIESGASVDGERVRLTDHEVAARLAYALTESPPDKALSDAADAGQLKTTAQLEAHAARLMATPQGKSRFKRFVFD